MEKQADLPVLRKHVSAIHIGAADYGLMHKKCVNAALYMAREMVKIDYRGDVEGFLEETSGMEVNHKVSLTDFKSLINYNSNDNLHLKQVLTKLVTTPVEFNVLGPRTSDDTWEVMSILSHAKIDGSVVSFRFPSEIREQLINPKTYANISLYIQNQFSSDHALSLYENTYRYHRISKTPWIKIDDLKKLLSISADAYPEFKDLNKKVIKKSIKEVSELSNISLEAEYHRKGRRVYAVRFLVKVKQERDLFMSSEELNDCEPELQLQLSTLGLNENQISQLFDKFDVSYLLSKTEWLISKIKSDDSIKNSAAFAWAAIIDNYEDNAINVKGSDSLMTRDNEASIEVDDNSKKLMAQYGKKRLQ